MEFLFAVQRWIYEALAQDLAAFAAGRDGSALAAMLPLGVLFGALHALTPGHSKTVLASYLVGARLAATRSLAVAGMLALTHVASAVILALAGSGLVSRSLGSAGQAPLLEDLSRGVLAAIGLWLIWCAWRGRVEAHGHGLLVGAVAGLVPCPLTLFAMIAALSRGVPEAGLVFAAAMALGVAVTLCAVALATVLARDRLVGLTTRHGASVNRTARALEGLAGVLLLLIGLAALLR